MLYTPKKGKQCSEINTVVNPCASLYDVKS